MKLRFYVIFLINLITIFSSDSKPVIYRILIVIYSDVRRRVTPRSVADLVIYMFCLVIKMYTHYPAAVSGQLD